MFACVFSCPSSFLRGRFLVRVRVFVHVCVFSCVFAWTRACFRFFFYKFPAQISSLYTQTWEPKKAVTIRTTQNWTNLNNPWWKLSNSSLNILLPVPIRSNICHPNSQSLFRQKLKKWNEKGDAPFVFKQSSVQAYSHNSLQNLQSGWRISGAYPPSGLRVTAAAFEFEWKT